MSVTTRAAWDLIYPCEGSDGWDPTFKAIADRAGIGLVWSLTGRRVGTFDVIGERFLIAGCSESGWSAGGDVVRRHGEWAHCSCAGGATRLMLSGAPLRRVDEVRVSGAALAATAYWTDGAIVVLEGVCPSCGTCGGEPTVEVDYRWGVPAGSAARAAAGEIACEYMKGIAGQPCRLSARAVSVARQGMQIDLADAFELTEEGLTGLDLTDAYIREANPNRLRQRSRVMTPDLPSAIR